MKLTKGKLSKIYNKKKQTMRKFKIKVKKVRREKTFRKKRPLNLNSKTLKHFNHYDSRIEKVSAALSEYINEVVTEKILELKKGGDPNEYQNPEEATNAAASTFGAIVGTGEEPLPDYIPSEPSAPPLPQKEDGEGIEMMPIPSAPERLQQGEEEEGEKEGEEQDEDL
jgi:hypothetical protein